MAVDVVLRTKEVGENVSVSLTKCIAIKMWYIEAWSYACDFEINKWFGTAKEANKYFNEIDKHIFLALATRD